MGLVPTMGSLHHGHLSLIEKANKENDIVWVSIFINPTQFNDPNDLSRYPKNLEKEYQNSANRVNELKRRFGLEGYEFDVNFLLRPFGKK